MSKKQEAKRWLRFFYDDGSYKDLRIAKCTTLHKKIDKVALHLDKIGEKDGVDQYLMIANESFLPDGKRLDKIHVVREEDIDEFDKGGN